MIVYSTPTCPHCNTVKTYLKERGVEFEEYDVSADKEKAKEMVIKSKQRKIPVLDINGTIIIGFDRRKIDEVLSGAVLSPVLKTNMLFDPMDQ